jgi:23S rRNA pseudouridine1911/1915/1917 synthase
MEDLETNEVGSQHYTYTCETEAIGIRPDKYLTSVFPDLNRSQIKKCIDSGQVYVNGGVLHKKQSFSVGDVIEIVCINSIDERPHAVDIPLDIVFEDEDMIVVNKAVGMTVHPGNGTGADTLVHALLHHCKGQLSILNGEDRPGVVHRLDKDTSGLIIAAKSDAACTRLLAAFKQRAVVKEYLAVVAGEPRLNFFEIKEPIFRHKTNRTRMCVDPGGRFAHTDMYLMGKGDGYSLVKCVIHTGRTHQIRVHLAHCGHPIVGDQLYGFRRNQLRGAMNLIVSRPLLHAYRLVLDHPVAGKKMEFCAEPPDDFLAWSSRVKVSEQALLQVAENEEFS